MPTDGVTRLTRAVSSLREGMTLRALPGPVTCGEQLAHRIRAMVTGESSLTRILDGLTKLIAERTPHRPSLTGKRHQNRIIGAARLTVHRRRGRRADSAIGKLLGGCFV